MIISQTKNSSSLASEWGYDEILGPNLWSKVFNSANGKHQSPVDIQTNQAIYDEKLNENPLTIDYDGLYCNVISNTGTTFQVQSSNDISSTLSSSQFLVT